MALEFTFDPDDIVSARLLAIGIRPRLEFSLFVLAVAVLLAWSVSPWSFFIVPLLIGLTASLAAFRVIQISKVRDAALGAFRRNPTLRRSIAASWDGDGVTIQPAGTPQERIPWSQLQQYRENERVILLLQDASVIHAIPKRAFPDKATLVAFRALARHRDAKLRR